MAKVLKVTRSEYYRWLKGTARRKKKMIQEFKLIKLIENIQIKNNFSFGIPRIYRALEERSMKVNRKRIARLMRQNALNAKHPKKYKRTTNSEHSYRTYPNLLKRNFKSIEPNKKWVSDITYLKTKEGWYYLCVVIDLFSRKVVGWSLNERLNELLVLRALSNSIDSRRPQRGLIFHTDQGIQYCSKSVKHALNSIGAVQSMSRKGNCWDNACAESFFKSMKTEWLENTETLNRQQVKNLVFEYIEIFYNRARYHSYSNFLSPENFERKAVA